MKNITITGSYTDFYEITMAQAYFLEGKKDTKACFDYFFRKLPFGGGFVVFAGLQDFLDVISDLIFTEDEIEFFRTKKFHPSFIEYLKNFKFTGSVYSVNEGDLIFPNLPALRIEGNIIETQIVETILLNFINFSSLVATKAARMRLVAGDRILSEFGLRRAHGPGGILASHAAVMGGFDSTSNLYSAIQFGLELSGTMAHSYVQSQDDEITAFRNYSNAHPQNSIFLLDTIDTIQSGLPNAIQVAKEMEERGQKLTAVRLDSGDLAFLSKKTRKALDANNLQYVKIIVSNQLDEYLIKSLIDQQAPIDIFGVGSSIVTGQPDASIDGIYKLSMAGGQPRIKLSESIIKVNFPGIKQAYRLISNDGSFYGGDVVCLDYEENPGMMHHPFQKNKQLDISKFRKEKLLFKRMERGKLTSAKKSPEEIRIYLQHRLSMLPQEFKRFDFPHEYKVGISTDLENLREELRKKLSIT